MAASRRALPAMCGSSSENASSGRSRSQTIGVSSANICSSAAPDSRLGVAPCRTITSARCSTSRSMPFAPTGKSTVHSRLATRTAPRHARARPAPRTRRPCAASRARSVARRPHRSGRRAHRAHRRVPGSCRRTAAIAARTSSLLPDTRRALRARSPSRARFRADRAPRDALAAHHPAFRIRHRRVVQDADDRAAAQQRLEGRGGPFVQVQAFDAAKQLGELVRGARRHAARDLDRVGRRRMQVAAAAQMPVQEHGRAAAGRVVDTVAVEDARIDERHSQQVGVPSVGHDRRPEREHEIGRRKRDRLRVDTARLREQVARDAARVERVLVDDFRIDGDRAAARGVMRVRDFRRQQRRAQVAVHDRRVDIGLAAEQVQRVAQVVHRAHAAGGLQVRRREDVVRMAERREDAG